MSENPRGDGMSRRNFLMSIAAFAGASMLPSRALSSCKILQVSPVAGFQYHEGEAVWPLLAVNQPLQLVREADNAFDPRAVRIAWRGRKLGYVPRLDNAAVSQLLDRGERLEAAIFELKESLNSWERIKVEVRWRI